MESYIMSISTQKVEAERFDEKNHVCLSHSHFVLYYIPNQLAILLRGIKLLESESEVTQSCPALCDPMDCSLPGSSVRGIFQARVLEWVAISFSKLSCLIFINLSFRI